MDMEKLFEVVGKAVEIGEFRMGFQRTRILDGVLFWKFDTGEILGIDPDCVTVFLADEKYKPLKFEFSNELEAELPVICRSLESAIEVAETGIFGFFPRLNRFIHARYYEATNRFRKINRYMGYPLNEVSHYRKYSLMAVASKIIELGTEKVALKSSKVHNGKLYLFQGDDGYAVIDPQDLTGKGHFLYRASSLEDQDLVVMGISHGNEKDLTETLRS